MLSSSFFTSPSFFVGVSFLIFFTFSWKIVKKTFLNAIDNYRNSIVTMLNDVNEKRRQSIEILDKSQKELSDANLNDYVLNAHKVAKDIMDSSAIKIKEIETSVVVSNTALSVKSNIESKIKNDILLKTSLIVEKYIECHKNDFNAIAMKQIFSTLKK